MLSYAAWEGFWNECATLYIEFLSSKGAKVTDVRWLMLMGVFASDFDSLRDRASSWKARHDFVAGLQQQLNAGFDTFDEQLIRSRSNLDFDALTKNYELLGFDLQPFQRYRLRLDNEIVAWRHGVAHGRSPDLRELDVDRHVSCVIEMLALVADEFERAAGL